jgi:hypothetical protein
MTVNKRYQVSCYVFIPSGQTLDYLLFGQAGIGLQGEPTIIRTKDEWVYVERELTAKYTSVCFYDASAAAANDFYYIDDLSARKRYGLVDCQGFY